MQGTGERGKPAMLGLQNLPAVKARMHRRRRCPDDAPQRADNCMRQWTPSGFVPGRQRPPQVTKILQTKPRRQEKRESGGCPRRNVTHRRLEHR